MIAAATVIAVEKRRENVRRRARVERKDIENPPEKAIAGTVWMKSLGLVD